jgi:hypothetical protein
MQSEQALCFNVRVACGSTTYSAQSTSVRTIIRALAHRLQPVDRTFVNGIAVQLVLLNTIPLLIAHIVLCCAYAMLMHCRLSGQWAISALCLDCGEAGIQLAQAQVSAH